MGLRLDVYNNDYSINFYGTKHYGYSFSNGFDAKKYASYRYLKRIKKLKDSDVWYDGYCPKIRLTAEQFERFINLYAKEIDYTDILQDEDIIKLLEDKTEKIVSWC